MNYREIAHAIGLLLPGDGFQLMLNCCPSKNILWMNRGDIKCPDFMLRPAVLAHPKILNILSTTSIKMG